jgi:hypothetical protein
LLYRLAGVTVGPSADGVISSSSLRGKTVESYLDGKLTLTHERPVPVSGTVGVWSSRRLLRRLHGDA